MCNVDLQKEPLNPVVLIKEGKKYNPSMALKLNTPFILQTKYYTVEVKTGDVPVYFKRKILRVQGGKISLADIKYVIGFCRDKQKIYHFLDSTGKHIEAVEEWL